MTTTPEVMRRFAGQLRDAMDARRQRQWQVAEKAGMTQGRVSDILTGRYPDVRLSTLCRIANAADCDLDIVVKPRER